MNYGFKRFPSGHDFGNTKLCEVIYVNGMENILTMPSALCEGDHDELASKITDGSFSAGIQGMLGKTSHTITIQGKSFFVGDLAIQQSPNVPINQLTGRGQISRYWDIRSLAALLSASGSLINDTEYGLDVVTNLPIITHTDENTKRVKAALEGDHQFTLNGRTRIAHVRVKKTIIEGAGAIIAYGQSTSAKSGSIDPGGRTTDLYMVERNVPIRSMCQTLDVGVETAFDEIAKQFEDTYGIPLLATDRKALQRCYVQGKNYSDIPTVMNAEADPYKLDEMIDQVVRTTGKEIVNFIKSVWGSSMRNDVVATDVKTIIAAGGGPYFFIPELESLFKKRLFVPDQSELANARGYAKLAQHFLQREMRQSQVS